MKEDNKMENNKMAIAIILYNPDEKVINYIKNLRKIAQKIYLYDNTESEKEIKKTKESLGYKGILYYSKCKNMGLAYGLNVCCRHASRDGFDWIMLFDQDSIINGSFLDNMCEFIKKYDEDKLGIVAPMINDFNRRNVKENKAKRKKQVITSGMTLKLKAFRDIGLFCNDLFIDAVDIEYCLRLYKKGYFILENNQAVLQHNKYDKQQIYGGYKVNKYSPLRHYYIARGYCYIIKNYDNEKKFIPWFKTENYNRFIGMIYYDNQRIKKIIAIILGIFDYYRGSFGKCKWNMLK